MTAEFVTRETLRQAEEQLKRRWQMLLILASVNSAATRGQQLAPATVLAGATIAPTQLAAESLGRILVVEPDPSIAHNLVEMLQRGGYDIVKASDPQDAVRRAPETQLVILDEELPNLKELMSNLRERYHQPVVLLGSYRVPGTRSDVEGWGRALSTGADAFLRNSISSGELLARINAIMRRYPRSSSIGLGTVSTGGAKSE